MPIDCTAAEERFVRIQRLIEQYRHATRRRLVLRAMRLWREAEADRQLLKPEAQPERVH
jgi:hypothetical protein